MAYTTDILTRLEQAAAIGQPVLAHEHQRFCDRYDLDRNQPVARRLIRTAYLGSETVKQVSFERLSLIGERESLKLYGAPILGEITVKLEVLRSWEREPGEKGDSQWAQIALGVTNEALDISYAVTPMEKDVAGIFEDCLNKWGFLLGEPVLDSYPAQIFELNAMPNLPSVVLDTLKEFDS